MWEVKEKKGSMMIRDFWLRQCMCCDPIYSTETVGWWKPVSPVGHIGIEVPERYQVELSVK